MSDYRRMLAFPCPCPVLCQCQLHAQHDARFVPCLEALGKPGLLAPPHALCLPRLKSGPGCVLLNAWQAKHWGKEAQKEKHETLRVLTSFLRQAIEKETGACVRPVSYPRTVRMQREHSAVSELQEP